MTSPLQNWLTTLADQYESYQKPAHLWSMTTRRELCFCESYARDCFSGEGKIVDLGCWYGATTYCLAQGLAQNTRAKGNRTIEAFDRFIWQEGMDQIADSIQMPVIYQPGQSFFHDVQNVVAPYKTIVRLHQQDLRNYQPPQQPIEFLFVDAMKTWPLAQNIVRSFFPQLIPGLSVVVQQDFVWYAPIVAAIHLIMWRLRDYFEWIHHVPHSASVAFVSKERIPQSSLRDLAVESFSLDEIDQAYDYSLACVPEAKKRPTVAATKLLFLIERGHYEGALAHAERLVADNIKFTEEIILAGHQIIEAHQNPAVSDQPAVPYRIRRADKLEVLVRIESILPALAITKSSARAFPKAIAWLAALRTNRSK